MNSMQSSEFLENPAYTSHMNCLDQLLRPSGGINCCLALQAPPSLQPARTARPNAFRMSSNHRVVEASSQPGSSYRVLEASQNRVKVCIGDPIRRHRLPQGAGPSGQMNKKINENLWKSIKIHENPWKSMKIHEPSNHRVLEPSSQPKSSKGLYMGSNPLPQVATGCDRLPGILVKWKWKSFKIDENRWKSMETYENRCKSMTT